MEDERSPQLPYLTQDLWTCDRTLADIDAWVLEDEDLKVTVTPQFAGKVWTIFDKKRGKDVLFNNRAHQPANIAALKAWASGGAEWNWSPGIIGHSAFSETGVFLASVDTPRGPMLRVYEFDRYNGTVWQVDMLIANGSFLAHPKVTNPSEVDLRGYWWTCVAVEAVPGTRIFAPATHVAETSRNPIRNAPWPFFAEAVENASFSGYQGRFLTDNSFLGNHQLGDMFLRIPDSVYTPYIAHSSPESSGSSSTTKNSKARKPSDLTGEESYVLVHGHPLNGTKFFTWGDSGPGRFMQDFLAGGGKRLGDYAELQVGPAPTQMQNFPVPRNSALQWTEWFKGFDGDKNTLMGEDYSAAVGLIDSWIQSEAGMTREGVAEVDAFFQAFSSAAPSQVLVQGQVWGALEELLLGAPLAPGLTFSLPTDPLSLQFQEARPWVELVEKGTFSEETLARLPVSYQTTDRWLALLEASAAKYGMTWLHALHLGICYAERGDISGPVALFSQSLQLKPNPVAARCLAVLQQTQTAAWDFYQQAWAAAVDMPANGFERDLLPPRNAKLSSRQRVLLNLITELSFFLQQALWYEEMALFEATVEQGGYLGGHTLDAFETMKIRSLLQREQFAEAMVSLKKNCFPTYAKARDDLMALWNSAVVGLAQQQSQTTLSYADKHRVRVANPVPENIGCQYASEYCTSYW